MDKTPMRDSENHAVRSPLSLWFHQWEKRAQGAPSYCGSWEPALWSDPLGITGGSAGLHWWVSGCDGEWGRVCNNWHLGVGGLSSSLRAQTAANQRFAYLQPSQESKSPALPEQSTGSCVAHTVGC